MSDTSKEVARRIRVRNTQYNYGPCIVHIPFECNTPEKIAEAVKTHRLLNSSYEPIKDELYFAALLPKY